jgi:HAD superfamily hydrolase (TIGR01509 family)
MFSKLLCLLRCQRKHKRVGHATSSSLSETRTERHADTTSATLDTKPPGKETPSTNRILILDLGDVLFHYAVREITALSPSMFKAVITTPGWRDFECGRVNEEEALASITKELSLDLDTIREALTQCRQLLHVDHNLYDQLRALKAEMNGTLKVYAMTNISRDDFARLKIILPNWDLFDAEFTSFEAGMIKPDLQYYQHVLDNIKGADTASTIFVDDKLVNVDAARSFGIHGIVFESPTVLMDQLRSQLLPHISRQG